MSLTKWFIPFALSTAITTGASAALADDNSPRPVGAGPFSVGTQFISATKPSVPAVHFMPSEVDFKAYAGDLKINAQAAPYNLPGNVFILTRSDMARIAANVRQKLAAVSTVDLLKPLLEKHENLSRAIREKGFDKIFDLQKLEGLRGELINGYVLAHQSGFVEYTYRQAGYGRDTKSALDFFKACFDLSPVPLLTDEGRGKLKKYNMSPEEMELINIGVYIANSTLKGSGKSITFDDLNDEKIAEFRLGVESMARDFGKVVADMDKEFLKRLVGETLLSLEMRDYMKVESSSDGAMGVLAPNAFNAPILQPEGSVLVGDDGEESDGYFIQSALGFDLTKISPDFMRLSYLTPFINFHETGHHVVGDREELAEQYGALKFLKESPHNAGALKMMRDFRHLYFLISDNPDSLIMYGRTAKSLDYALTQNPQRIAGLDENDIKAAAREGHEPDEVAGKIIQINLLAFVQGDTSPKNFVNMEEVQRQQRKIGEIAAELALRVKLYEEYQRQENRLGVAEKSGTIKYYRVMNTVLLAASKFWQNPEATFEKMFGDPGISQALKSARGIQQMEVNPDIDPEILLKAADTLLGSYSPGSLEHKMLSDAATALRNFKDPVRAYGLKPNFQPQPEPEDMVIPLTWDTVRHTVVYDEFEDIDRELKILDGRLAPLRQVPDIGFGVGRPVFGPGSGVTAGEVLDAMRKNMMGMDPVPSAGDSGNVGAPEPVVQP